MAVSGIAAKLQPMTSDEHALVERGQRIRDRIEAGRAAKKLNATKVAKQAGVSRTTVDSAMKGRVPEDTLAQIETAIETLEERADRAAHPEDYAATPVAAPVVQGEDIVEVELHGVFGVQRVIVRSRPEHLKEEIIATIQALRETSLPE